MKRRDYFFVLTPLLLVTSACDTGMAFTMRDEPLNFPRPRLPPGNPSPPVVPDDVRSIVGGETVILSSSGDQWLYRVKDVLPAFSAHLDGHTARLKEIEWDTSTAYVEYESWDVEDTAARPGYALNYLAYQDIREGRHFDWIRKMEEQDEAH